MAALLIGYARCSTDQTRPHRPTLRSACPGRRPSTYLRRPWSAGTNRDRPGLREALAACREGRTVEAYKET